MSVQASTATQAVRMTTSEFRDGALPAGHLLPPPGLVTGADLAEGALALEALTTKQGRSDVKDVELQVARFRRASAEQTKKMLEAIQRQRELEKEEHSGFWAKLKSIASSVAKIASVVAAAASIVASGGATLPMVAGIAAVALSGGGMAVRELRLFGGASDKIGLGMEICGAATGLGGAAAAIFLRGAAATGALASAGKVVSASASGVNASALAGASAGGVVVAGIARDADREQANAEEAKGEVDRRHDESQQLIDWLRAVKASEREYVESTAKVIEASNQAAGAAAAGVKG